MGITGLYKILSACGDDTHLNEYRNVINTDIDDVIIMTHKSEINLEKVVKLSPSICHVGYIGEQLQMHKIYAWDGILKLSIRLETRNPRVGDTLDRTKSELLLDIFY